MYTLKMIIDGDVSIREEESITLSRAGGKLFNTALELVEESKQMAVACAEGQQAQGALVHGVDAVTAHKKPLALETSAVELCTDGDEQFVLCAGREGNRELNTAIGVVVTTLENGARYEFVYAGDQVYVVNRDGRTVETLR